MLKKSDSKVVILRSAVGSPPSMSLINELRKQDVKVIGLDSNPLSAGLYLCDKGYLVPKGDDPKFLEEIIRICKIEKPNMILSGPEEEILTLSKNKNIFEKQNILVLCPDYKDVLVCVDKQKTYKLFKTLDIPTPQVFSRDIVKFPCIVKPRFGRGSKDVYIAKNRNELKLYLSIVKKPIIQEYVTGTEYSIDVFSNLDGTPLSILPRIRIQTESGISIKGKTVYDKKLIDYCKKITKKLKLIGPSCIQCIKNDNGVKFLEINTRFGGGSILSIKANPSIISNLIRLAKGEIPISNSSFKEGMIMLRYYDEVFLRENEILSAKDS